MSGIIKVHIIALAMQAGKNTMSRARCKQNNLIMPPGRTITEISLNYELEKIRLQAVYKWLQLQLVMHSCSSSAKLFNRGMTDVRDRAGTWVPATACRPHNEV